MWIWAPLLNWLYMSSHLVIILSHIYIFCFKAGWGPTWDERTSLSTFLPAALTVSPAQIKATSWILDAHYSESKRAQIQWRRPRRKCEVTALSRWRTREEEGTIEEDSSRGNLRKEIITMVYSSKESQYWTPTDLFFSWQHVRLIFSGKAQDVVFVLFVSFELIFIFIIWKDMGESVNPTSIVSILSWARHWDLYRRYLNQSDCHQFMDQGG